MKTFHVLAVGVALALAGQCFAAEPSPKWLPVRQLKVDQVNPVILYSKEFANEQTDSKRTGIAIRGIYSPTAQKKNLQRTCKKYVLPSDFESPAFDPNILDFTLERQALPHRDEENYSEVPWEKVDYKQSVKLLEKVASYDDDLIEPNESHYAITMPLPSRKDGTWDSKISHPALEGETKDQLWLFRYIDFDVKPNTYYRYRVRLKIANPLNQIKTENPFLSAGKFRETQWSEPSPAILVTPIKAEN